MGQIYILAAVLIAGWAAAYIGLRRALQRACKRMRAELRLEFQQQIEALTEKVRTRTLEGAGETTGAAARTAGGNEEITPEILRTITETVSALLGRKVRIRSVKILQTPDATTNSWAQQGRVVVHASHNLAPRGHEL
jgi:hypothetical protein